MCQRKGTDGHRLREGEVKPEGAGVEHVSSAVVAGRTAEKVDHDGNNAAGSGRGKSGRGGGNKKGEVAGVVKAERKTAQGHEQEAKERSQCRAGSGGNSPQNRKELAADERTEGKAGKKKKKAKDNVSDIYIYIHTAYTKYEVRSIYIYMYQVGCPGGERRGG